MHYELENIRNLAMWTTKEESKNMYSERKECESHKPKKTVTWSKTSKQIYQICHYHNISMLNIGMDCLEDSNCWLICYKRFDHAF